MSGSDLGTENRAFFSVLLIVTALGGIAAPLVGISKASSASAGLFSAIEAPRPIPSGLKEPEVSAHEDIIFENVTFAYPARPGNTVLRNLTLRFASGQTTAIVGPSGCGKSTLIGLLERWYHLSHTEPITSNPVPPPR